MFLEVINTDEILKNAIDDRLGRGDRAVWGVEGAGQAAIALFTGRMAHQAGSPGALAPRWFWAGGRLGAICDRASLARKLDSSGQLRVIRSNQACIKTKPHQPSQPPGLDRFAFDFLGLTLDVVLFKGKLFGIFTQIGNAIEIKHLKHKVHHL